MHEYGGEKTRQDERFRRGESVGERWGREEIQKEIKKNGERTTQTKAYQTPQGWIQPS